METRQIKLDIEVYDEKELSETDFMLASNAIKATQNSYSPYSLFRVGACLLLDDDTTMVGANQENAAYPVGLCAERAALFAAQSQCPSKSVKAIAIAARDASGQLTYAPITPCGSCRQVLLEIEERYGHDIRIILYGRQCVYVVKNARSLLPLSFHAQDLTGEANT